MSVALYIMNRKGLSVLQAVLKQFGPDAIACVVSATDQATHDRSADDILRLCESEGVPFFWRESSRPRPDHYLSIAAGWRWMIHDEPKLVVLHDSLLPRYRGFNPLVTAICNGDTEIGVTALWADKSYDAGPIIAQMYAEISYPMTIDRAIGAVLPLYRQLAVRVVQSAVDGRLEQGRPQVDSEATYSLWRDEHDYLIDWSRDAEYIARFVDAHGYPYKGARGCMPQVVRIGRVSVLPDIAIENRTPGKVIRLSDGMPEVVCGAGIIRIEELDDVDGRSLLPMKSLRVRFGGTNGIP